MQKVSGQYAKAAVILANLLVLAILLVRGDGLWILLLVYWVETLVIGGLFLPRLWLSCLGGDPLGSRVGVSWPARLLLAFVASGVFLLHFTGYAVVSGMVLLMVPGVVEGQDAMIALADALRGHGAMLLWMFVCLAIWHTALAIRHEWTGSGARQTPVWRLMWLPYRHIWTVMAGILVLTLYLQLMPGSAGADLLLVPTALLKTLLDLRALRKGAVG